MSTTLPPEDNEKHSSKVDCWQMMMDVKSVKLIEFEIIIVIVLMDNVKSGTTETNKLPYTTVSEKSNPLQHECL